MGTEKYTFLNRDMSWLGFNHRVLREATDESVPLYNRIGFLAIFSSNLDEFFRVRMPSILAFTSIKAKKTTLREYYPKNLVKLVKKTVFQQLEEFGSILKSQILPALRENKVYLYYGDPLKPDHRETVREHFLSHVLSFLQPVFLQEQNRENAFLENNALYFLVSIHSKDFEQGYQYALVNIPSAHMSRFIELEELGGCHHIIFLDDIIRENLEELFPGFSVAGAWSIKLTRDAEMLLEDEFSGDLAEKIEKQLEKRDVGIATRLLYDKTISEDALSFIQEYFFIGDDELLEGGRYHNLKDLADLPNPGEPHLTYEDWPPIRHKELDNHHSIFDRIAEGEKLLHLPYHSYNYILRFFNEAAIDPNVSEIFVTLYRVAAHSFIVNALISAAKNGKKVVVFVELKARFDEANNIRWSKKMKDVGIKIINSIPRLKVHAKVALVKRREQGEWKYYSFLATGNFNETTGRFYSDQVYFSAFPEYGEDLVKLFDYLQSRKQPYEYQKVSFRHLLVSQFNMIREFNRLIDQEIKNAKKGKQAGIVIKVNNLQEKQLISKLYQASQAGVRIDILSRSVCCLAPGVAGQSEHIRVLRIVDRYLEHSRIFVFHNNGKPLYYLGSADWMNRNLHNRIEVVFPVYDQKLQQQLQHILDVQLMDYRKGVLLNEYGDNQVMRINNNEKALSSQRAIYEWVRQL